MRRGGRGVAAAGRGAGPGRIGSPRPPLPSQQKGVGMNEPLVDAEGFPRDDIDLYQVRTARHNIICEWGRGGGGPVRGGRGGSPGRPLQRERTNETGCCGGRTGRCWDKRLHRYQQGHLSVSSAVSFCLCVAVLQKKPQTNKNPKPGML